MVKDTLSKIAANSKLKQGPVFQYLPLFERVMEINLCDRKEEQVLNRLIHCSFEKRISRTGIHFSHEAIEMHGGNGFIEDFVTPRLLRDAQVLTVWEGTANIFGLEVLRLIEKFKGDDLFIEAMKQRLQALPEDEWSAKVRHGIALFRSLTLSLRQATADHKTFHSKKIAEVALRIFESVHALEYGAKGNERARKVMEIYLEEAWKDDNRFNREMRTVNYFDEVVSASTIQMRMNHGVK